ncbi:4-hydroxy-tetrahydrodipicolinate reductase [Paraferrimonas sedimenticola]|uniref:4-hydroxy-tetrahydrodipicolinate reductase n=1 Tax=Paraferrimonas sedimenticola TaxID=375674 RepID=A0AA37RX58_9GAMM|nr:4-hydroxy-tetrahydrodipicolinate reductase [Paraferrimonas sedimenticola]GLP97086.1 4-hydroxy-tetrahydrodipicolinate reductase [Paraferrimonas sedimenticola]
MTQTNSIKLAIAGATGRMGKVLIEAAHNHPQIQLIAASVRPGSSLTGADAGELAGIGKLGVTLVDDLSQSDFDVLVDFTSPESCLELLSWCAAHNKAMVIGTTGFSDEQLQALEQHAQNTKVVFAPNMSVGVNLMWKLLEVASEVIGEQCDIEIQETHHRFKKDAPSGTALKMGEVIAAKLGRNLADVAIYGREGMTGERDPNTIGFATTRAGDVIGDHTALFADIGERLEITHKSSSRMTYANGAMRASVWLVNQPNGLYDMQQVLGLNTEK